MTKKEVQARVLQRGKPLAMSKFSWDEKTNTFSSEEYSLVLDFRGISHCTFKTGSDCTFKTGSNCTFKTDSNCTFTCYSNAFIVNKEKNNVLVLRESGTQEIIDLNNIEKGKFYKFEIGKKAVAKEIKETKFVDNGIYVLLTEPKQVREFITYKAQRLNDYFADAEKSTTVVEKQHNEKTYYAHGTDLKNAIESVNFKIASENFDSEKTAKDIQENGNTINWLDYRLITGSCESMTKEWLVEHGYDTDTRLSIHEFYKKYKDKNVYAFERFAEFYEEFFKGEV